MIENVPTTLGDRTCNQKAIRQAKEIITIKVHNMQICSIVIKPGKKSLSEKTGLKETSQKLIGKKILKNMKAVFENLLEEELPEIKRKFDHAINLIVNNLPKPLSFYCDWMTKHLS